MDETPYPKPHRITGILESPRWQGVSGIAALISLFVPLSIAVFGLITGNIRILLWLYASAVIVPLLLLLSSGVLVAALYILLAKQPHASTKTQKKHTIPAFPNWLRRTSWAFGLLALVFITTFGIRTGISSYDNSTSILIADFLNPDGKDDRAITRGIITEIKETLKDFPEIKIRELRAPIVDIRGEGGSNARQIGKIADVDIVIWGDYLDDDDRTTFVHLELLTSAPPHVAAQSNRIYGKEDYQQVMAIQQSSAPSSVAFSIALGEHLGALVAFAAGTALLDLELYAESIRYFDKAAEVDNNPLAKEIIPAVRHWRGIARFAMSELASAESNFTAALDEIMTTTEPTSGLSRQEVYLWRGTTRLRLQNMVEAISDFDQVIALDPQNVEAYNSRGIAHIAQGALTEALTDLDQAIALNPQFAAAYINRGNAFLNLGNFSGALADYEQAIALEPQNTAAYVNRGRLLMNQGDYTESMADYNRAIAFDPLDARAYYSRGYARVMQGDLTGALDDFEQSIALDPQNAAAYISRGNIRRENGDQAGAFADYEHAILLDPRNANAYVSRGNSRSVQGNLAGALSDYEYAMSIDSGYAPAYYNRGIIRGKQGDLAGALADFDKAIDLEPQYAHSFNARGAIRLAQNDLVGALAAFDQAILHDPRLVEAYNNRRLVYEAQGNFEGAIEDLSTILDIQPNHQNRAWILEQIDFLSGQLPND